MKTSAKIVVITSLFLPVSLWAWEGDTWGTITRSKIKELADAMIDLRWSPANTINNFQHYNSNGSENRRTYTKGVTYTGVAYSQGIPWGAQDNLAEFIDYTSRTGAGNKAYGNDCSGFVSICWKLSARQSTATFESGLNGSYWSSLGGVDSVKNNSFPLLMGDALNSPASLDGEEHMVMFLEFVSSGIKTMEQTVASAGGAQRLVKSYDYLTTQNYRPIRRKNISETQTAPVAPSIGTASGISSSGFTANWSASSGATGYRLDVSTSSNFSSYLTGYNGVDVGNATSRAITGLSADTTYYYRVRAFNSSGTSGNSSSASVKTITATVTKPTVRTDAATNITSTGAILRGTIISNGGTTVNRLQFGWGTNSTQHTASITHSSITVSGTSFSATLSGLEPNTTYYFSAWASNSNGSTWGNGEILSFKTSGGNTGSPDLTYLSSVIHDGSGGGNGDSDGKIDAGEEIDLDVTLRNAGTVTATNVAATLSTSDPYLTIVDDDEPFADIAVGASVTSNADFDFSVSSAAPAGHQISFTLLITSDQSSWTRSFTLPVVAGSTPTPTPTPTPTTGLAAYWTFDNTFRDATGRGHDGTAFGTEFVADRHGRAASALRFDGSDYIRVSDADDFDLTGDLTLAMWIKPAAFGLQTLLAKHSPISNDLGTWTFNITNAGNSVSWEGTPHFDGSAMSTKEVLVGTWRHIAVTYKKSSQTITTYIDGEVDSSKVIGYSLLPGNLDLIIGAQMNDGFNPPFTWYYIGDMDDVRIYRSALSAAQIAAIVSPTPAATPPKAPTGLRFSPLTYTRSKARTQLSFTDNSTNEDRFVLEYSLKVRRGWTRWRSFTTISSGAGSTIKVGINFGRGELYRIRVKAVNAIGASSSPAKQIRTR